MASLIQDKVKWKLVPKYLIHIPIPYWTECDECGRKTYLHWRRKGFIQIGTKREYYHESPLMQYYDRVFLDHAIANVNPLVRKHNKGYIKFQGYSPLSVKERQPLE